MTRKLPWATAAVIIVVAAVGAWALWQPAALPTVTPSAPWAGLGITAVEDPGPPRFVYAAAPTYSGICYVHFMKHGYYNYNDNCSVYAEPGDNRLGVLTGPSPPDNSDGIVYNTLFDIVVEVKGHAENMYSCVKENLRVWLKCTDLGISLAYAPNENEYVYAGAGTDNIFVNVIWDNNGSGYILGPAASAYIENITLECWK